MAEVSEMLSGIENIGKDHLYVLFMHKLTGVSNEPNRW